MTHWLNAAALLLALLAMPALAWGAEATPAGAQEGHPHEAASQEEPSAAEGATSEHAHHQGDTGDAEGEAGDVPRDQEQQGPEKDHSEMDHSAMDQSGADHSQMDHSQMEDSQMDSSQQDHSQMGHGEMGHETMAGEHSIERTPATAPIEPYFASPEMDRARAEARREMGGGRFLMLQGDRIEWRSGEGEAVGLLEGQGWYGGDMNRLWVKTEAEFLFDAPRSAEELDKAEIQALYSRPVSAFFDLQAGVRHDIEPSPSRTYAVVGVQGLAPQWFEVDLALFLSEDGDLSSRLEAEYDMLLTQRLMLQLRTEVDLEASDVPELGLGSGLSSLEAGVRLSYGRVFAPYVGVSWEEKLGKTADFARADGEETGSVSAVVGFRFWY